MLPLHYAPEYFQQLLQHYGGFALFVLLALGIFGLPIPDETLLVFTGFLIAKSKIPILPTFIGAYAGSIVGVTSSYLLGFYIGRNAILRYGRFLGITQARLEKAHAWYERVGKWSLLIGYYIPGVRHFFGLAAGSAYLSYWRFALFAYTGALIWTTTFLSIGYFFYHEWQHWRHWLM